MTAFTNNNEWEKDGPNIMSSERLALVREVLDRSPIILEHWFFYGGRSPDCLVFDDYDAFLDYLRTQSQPGDSIHVWCFDTLCRNDNNLTHGKVPNAEGLTPKHGAY